MRWLLYFRLVALTAGTLLPFFWMVVILGHRRQRNFERLFFFLCLALTCFSGSSLLALNANLYYGEPPPGLLRFAWIFMCLGLWSVPPLLICVHVEYASVRELLPSPRIKMRWLSIVWIPAAVLVPKLFERLRAKDGFRFDAPSAQLGAEFQAWLIAAILVAAWWQWRFAKSAPDEGQRKFHSGLSWVFVGLPIVLLGLFVSEQIGNGEGTKIFYAAVVLLALEPLAKLFSGVQRANFLQIGRQRNLIYAVLSVFLALLYLSLVRRASLWLEPYLPPEASAALLLFLPVIFFEPLQRLMRRTLRQTAQTEVDRAQKLMGPITEVARLGDQAKLRKFCEGWIAEQLQLAEARLALDVAAGGSEAGEAKQSAAVERFEIRRGGQRLGWLQVRAFGAMISGETYAALEFLCEQLPAAFDLCRLIEEKLQLERELAERERLALVGQMAASISHNLKNPLGSIKTILQVQMESPELPASLRHETQMVLEEINRLSARLNQLLQFSRPGVRAGNGAQSCNLAQVAETVANMLRHAADERRVSLVLASANGDARSAVGEEAANDILSNVVLNAIEAVPDGGKVRIALSSSEKICTVSVEDDGPGISAADQAKVLRPFFTTKARGTGLGLAIVDRRLQETGGTMEIKSPLGGGRGTEIRLNFPLEKVL
ncbi:MAG TPA: ATP-binding protein [Candidatus Acidoferrales bacterium]|jgi:signal transduction histidine kinase|nr:ATP-binding protein [Candidatus Acidoferrales bacterium]